MLRTFGQQQHGFEECWGHLDNNNMALKNVEDTWNMDNGVNVRNEPCLVRNCIQTTVCTSVNNLPLTSIFLQTFYTVHCQNLTG